MGLRELGHPYFITPRWPAENGYIDCFDNKFGEECLNEHWFLTPDDARETNENCLLDYNQVHPNGSLGYLTPEEFAPGYPMQKWKAKSASHFHGHDGCCG